MHDGFFLAGQIHIVIYSSKSDIDFYCSAPNVWRDYRIDGLRLTDEKGRFHEVLAPAELDRDFPGWDLTSFVFDKIISAFCFLTSQAPRYTGLATKPSFHYVIDAKQNVRAVPDTGISESILGVSFFGNMEESIVKERHASFAQRLLSRDHRLIRIWQDRDDIPAGWKRPPEWWTIKDAHFHPHHEHVCSCYKDY